MSNQDRKLSPQLWQSVCDTYQVPAYVAVQIQANLLPVSGLEKHPQREQWHAEYQAEKQLDQKAVMRHRARAIANTLGLRTRTGKLDTAQATAVWHGKISPQAALVEARDRAERWAREKTRADALQLLVARGLPERMAEQLLDSLTSQDLAPQQVIAAWEKQLARSGFSNAGVLFDAWLERGAWTTTELEYARAARRERQLLEENAGMRPDHIAELCAADHLEHTLASMFHLNHWAKARDRLLYTDRQGLYRVKARLLKELYERGNLRSVSFTAASREFNPFAEATVDVVRDAVWDSWYSLSHGDQVDRRDDQIIRLYSAATQRALVDETEDGLQFDAVEQYVTRRLEELRQHAVATRQPIPIAEIEALFLMPDDIPAIAYDRAGNLRRSRFILTWNELNGTDLAALDPEWESLVGFQYESPSARYHFHLPRRVVEQFMSSDAIHQLPTNRTPRETGEYFGREITEAESLAHLIRELLSELGVAIEVVCPEELVDKGEYVAEIERERAARYPYWDEEDESADEGEDWIEDDWEEINRLPRTNSPRQQPADHLRCPICSTKIGATAQERLTHWRAQHADRPAVTATHAVWLLHLSKQGFKAQNIPPDYRTDEPPDRRNVRYWRLETLEKIQAVGETSEEAKP